MRGRCGSPVISGDPNADWKRRGIEIRCTQLRDEIGKRIRKLGGVLDGHQRQRLQRAHPRIPEIVIRVVVAHLGQCHRIAPGQLTGRAFGKTRGAGEAVRLHVARRAGMGVRDRQPPVMEEHSTQRGTCIGDRVTDGRGVAEFTSNARCRLKCHRQWKPCVFIGEALRGKVRLTGRWPRNRDNELIEAGGAEHVRCRHPDANRAHGVQRAGNAGAVHDQRLGLR